MTGYDLWDRADLDRVQRREEAAFEIGKEMSMDDLEDDPQLAPSVWATMDSMFRGVHRDLDAGGKAPFPNFTMTRSEYEEWAQRRELKVSHWRANGLDWDRFPVMHW